ncbi:hypothetical protein POM88_040421 [Heracleum sosnowskyi]|uniref:DUF4283 domain-containing protein n=1 Tax=Heracleum sosnowskyi TaxID=360622 RepID=A0AAD8M7E6_9APIA|nr:hypothetical protein POM88_040421 [Heracleum sosnowskyi]
MFMPMKVWVECKGLPMKIWLEENLKAYTMFMGEWLSWTYQRDDSNEFFNPLVCLSTERIDTREEKFKVMVKGKQLSISFSEVTNKNWLKGKILPMQDGKVRMEVKTRVEPEVDCEESENLYVNSTEAENRLEFRTIHNKGLVFSFPYSFKSSDP